MHLYQRTGFLLVLVSLMGLAACHSRDNDFKDILEAKMQIMGTYVNNLRLAKTSEAVADAISAYAAGIRSLGPRQTEFRAKYPEINLYNPPRSQKALFDKYEEMVKKVNESSAIIAAFDSSQDVQAAKEDLLQAWIDTQ